MIKLTIAFQVVSLIGTAIVILINMDSLRKLKQIRKEMKE